MLLGSFNGMHFKEHQSYLEKHWPDERTSENRIGEHIFYYRVVRKGRVNDECIARVV